MASKLCEPKKGDERKSTKVRRNRKPNGDAKRKTKIQLKGRRKGIRKRETKRDRQIKRFLNNNIFVRPSGGDWPFRPQSIVGRQRKHRETKKDATRKTKRETKRDTKRDMKRETKRDTKRDTNKQLHI